jgi:hypothetical protein
MSKDLNVGIVADWLVSYAGAEKVISEFIDIFPESELYSVVDFLSDKSRELFNNKKPKLHLSKTYRSRRRSIKPICHLCHLPLSS